MSALHLLDERELADLLGIQVSEAMPLLQTCVHDAIEMVQKQQDLDFVLQANATLSFDVPLGSWLYVPHLWQTPAPVVTAYGAQLTVDVDYRLLAKRGVPLGADKQITRIERLHDGRPVSWDVAPRPAGKATASPLASITVVGKFGPLAPGPLRTAALKIASSLYFAHKRRFAGGGNSDIGEFDVPGDFFDDAVIQLAQAGGGAVRQATGV